MRSGSAAHGLLALLRVTRAASLCDTLTETVTANELREGQSRCCSCSCCRGARRGSPSREGVQTVCSCTDCAVRRGDSSGRLSDATVRGHLKEPDQTLCFCSRNGAGEQQSRLQSVGCGRERRVPCLEEERSVQRGPQQLCARCLLLSRVLLSIFQSK